MAKFLTEEWIAEYKKLGGALPNRPGKNAIIQNVVSDGPNGEVRYFQVVENGVTTELALGEHPKPDVTLAQTYDVALKINSGDLNPNVAFMTGRVKPKGNVAKMMALLPLSQSAEYKAMEKHMAEITES
jgi:putative sterol carrier protein